MSYFDITPGQELAQANHASLHPATMDDMLATTFGGVGTGIEGGAFAGFGKAGQLLGDSAIPAGAAIDNTFGTSTADWLRAESAKTDAQVAKLKPNPYVVGKVGQGLGTFAEIGTLFTAGALAGGPAGGAALAGTAEGYAGVKEGIAAGLDPTTALLKGGVEGAAVAAGAYLPMSVAGAPLWKSLALGAGVNAGFGAEQRGLTSHILAQAGYPDMAAQYQMLDKAALGADLVLGLAFGGAGHLLHPGERPAPSAVDAALIAQEAIHRREGTMPGIAADNATLTAHEDALTKASADLLAGRPVDVSEQMDAAHFIPDPRREQFDADASAAILEEIGPTLEAAQRMQQELETPNPIAAAVVRFGGKEFDGATHIEAIKQAQAEGLLPRDAAGNLTLGPDDTINLFRLRDGSLVTRDEAGALTGAKRTEELPPLTGAASVEQMRPEIGWAQRGGQMIREAPTTEEARREMESGVVGAGQGAVIGRTPWIPKSDFWQGRPDKSLSEAGAHKALDKVAAGERLTAKEARFVDYSRRTLADRGAEVDAVQREADAERAAIQGEQDREVADPDLIAAGYLKLAPEERAAVEQWVQSHKELEAAREEIDRLAAEHRQAVPGEHGAPDTGATQPSAGHDRQGGQGAGREAGGQGNAVEGQDGLAQARAIAATRPDLHIVDDNGQLVPLHELLARADLDTAKDAETANLIQAAVDCALRGAA